MNLALIKEGKCCKVLKINLNERALKRLKELGIYEGACVRVSRKKNKAFLILSVLGVFYAVREKDAKNILVEEYE